MENQKPTEQKELTPEQVEEFRKKEIEFLEKIQETLLLRASVAKLKADIAEYSYKEASYIQLLAQMTPDNKGGDIVDHVVTKEDLKNFPELGKNGVKEGQTIQLPEEIKLRFDASKHSGETEKA